MTRSTLRALAHALTLAARALEDEAKASPRQQRPPTAARRKLSLTPKRKAALRLQGQYIGHMRMLPAKQQTAIRELRAEKGIEAAIRLARRLSAKR